MHRLASSQIEVEGRNQRLFRSIEWVETEVHTSVHHGGNSCRAGMKPFCKEYNAHQLGCTAASSYVKMPATSATSANTSICAHYAFVPSISHVFDSTTDRIPA